MLINILCIFGFEPFIIDAQQCMNVKIPHHHMNYFNLNYSFFLI